MLGTLKTLSSPGAVPAIAIGEAAKAEKAVRQFAAIFDAPYKPVDSSGFAGTVAECVKNGWGIHGHIATGANSVDRAVYHMPRRGVAFDESSRKTDVKGRIRASYLQGEIEGFALHLVQK